MMRRSVRCGIGLVVATVAIASCGSDDGAVPPAVSAESTVATASSGSVNVALPVEPMSAEVAAVIDGAATAALDAQAGDTPGMWIGVWDPARGAHLAAYGEAEAGGAAATVANTFRIGSITKTFTAAAILEQVAAGALSLDDSVADVLPDLATQAPEIADVTVEQLLAMRSGLSEYESRVLPQVLADPTEVIDLHEVILSTVSEQGVSTVGDQGTYSTANYLILGEMLAELTGQPVEAVLEQLVASAGLEHTALQPVDQFGMPDPASHGYVNTPAATAMQQEGVDVEPLGDVSDYTASWAGAGGSMYSTIEDLGRWAATDFGNTLLPTDLAAKRLESAPIDVGLDYGLGIITFPDGWHGHIGEIPGWESIALHQPETGAVFVGVVNESGSLNAVLRPAVVAFPDLATALG